ncbi:hypothetical protein BH24DEI2_BH24DEI2_20510 [soil metagenome]
MKNILSSLQFILCFSLLLVVYAQTAPGTPETAKADKPTGFVTRSGADLELQGKTFRFAGTNNYYLMYKSRKMVDAVLEKAAANNFKVMRTWGFLDIGNPDGSSGQKPADGVYFQYWDGEKPAYNDGPDGLERMDYIVAKAGQLGVKLIIPLTNNWSTFGGMDQYVRWAGGEYHDDFYRDPQVRAWYKDWISHMLNRVNTITGVAYKDDPTIMTWELANEPRCLSGDLPRSPDCDTTLLTNWVDEMSGYIKSVDQNHLVSVGDEGFYCTNPDSDDWTENCGEGVDTVAFAKLPTVDIMSLHLYPDHWDKDAAWAESWIESHIEAADALEKPVMLGEFGWQDKATRNPVFKALTDLALKQKIDGMLYWILSDVQDDDSLYPDYDGFTVYCPSPVCTTLSNFSLALNETQQRFAPVADNDDATTEFGAPATLKPLGNDVTYGASLVPDTLDLSPEAGRQTTSSIPGKGVFKVQGGALSFTPAQGFAGKVSIPYTVADRNRNVSNTATVTVTVLPKPTGATKLFDFEKGTDSWAPANWEAAGGTVVQSGTFATEGSYGLEVTSTGGGWFGLDFDEPLDLSNKTGIKYDLKSGGTAPLVALKIGPDYTWCQYSGSSAGEDTTTVSIAWDDFGCNFDAGDVRGMYLYFNSGSTSYIDNIRAE